MAREIKFRIWDNLIHKFIYFDVFNTFLNTPLDSRENIQEFTGLVDSDGKEIYEGDIVEFSQCGGFNTFTSNITFEIGCFGYCEKGKFLNLSRWPYFKKVIGNIFEK